MKHNGFISVAYSGRIRCDPEAPRKLIEERCATKCASASRNSSFGNVILLAPLLTILAFLALGMDVEANNAPNATIDSITPQMIDNGSTVTFTGHGNDTDGNVTGYSWRSSIDEGLSNSASFSATNMSVGNHTIYFKVKDNNGTWSSNVSSWLKVNSNPTATIDSITPQMIDNGSTVTFTGHGNDTDGNITGYSWRSSIDEGLSTSASFNATDMSVGNHTIYFKVKDDNGTWSSEVSSWLKVNSNPTATIDSITPQMIDYGSTVTFTGHGNDTDGNVTGYSWRSSIDEGLSTSASFNVTDMSVGNHTIYFKVKDDNGTWSSEVSSWLEVNSYPTATIDSITPNPADYGDTVSFSGSGSDSDGTITGYFWRSSIDGTLSTSASFSTTDLSAGNHTIYFKVKDDNGTWSPEVSKSLNVFQLNDPTMEDIVVNRTETAKIYANSTGGHFEEENLTVTLEYQLYRNLTTTPMMDYMLTGTDGGVRFTDISSDGKYFVASDYYISSSASRTKIDFFDISLQTKVWTLVINAAINDMDLSDDGTRLVMGVSGTGHDKYKNRVIVVDTNAKTLGERKASILWKYVAEGSVDSVSITDNAKFVAAGSNGYVYFFNVSAVDPSDPDYVWRNSVSYESYRGVVVSGDGSYVAAVDTSGGSSESLYLFEADGDQTWSTTSSLNTPRSIAISHDGSYIVVGGYYTALWSKGSSSSQWSTTTSSYVGEIYISDDGEHILGREGTSTVRAWDKDSSTPLWSKSVTTSSVTLSSDGTTAVIAHSDRDVMMYDFRTGSVFRSFDENHWQLHHMAISSNGEILIGGSHSSSKLLVFSRHNVDAQVEYSLNYLIDTDMLHFSNDDSAFVAIINGQRINYYYTNETSYNWTVDHSYSINSMDLSGDGSYVVVGADDDRIRLYLRNGSNPWHYEAGGDVISVAISDDGEYIVAGSEDNNIYVLERDGGVLEWSYGAGNDVVATDISSNGSTVAAIAGSKLFVFTATNGTPLWSVDMGVSLTSVSVSKDGNRIYAAGSNKIALFQRSSNSAVWTATIDETASRLSISDDGSYAAVSAASSVYLFGSAGSTPVWKHTTGGTVNSVSISGDGSFVTAGSSDKYIHYFSTSSAYSGWAYETLYSVKAVALSSDGQIILAGENYRILKMDGGQWFDFMLSTPGYNSDCSCWVTSFTPSAYLEEGVHKLRLKFTTSAGFATDWTYANITISNRRPIGTITAVTPDTIDARNVSTIITFSGTAKDYDGTITDYLWTSSIDGNLSTKLNFTLNSLQVSSGSHTINLTVMDHESYWSVVVGTTIYVNHHPTANITNVTPNPGTVADNISFNGTGTDADGNVTAYEWSFDNNIELMSVDENTLGYWGFNEVSGWNVSETAHQMNGTLQANGYFTGSYYNLSFEPIFYDDMTDIWYPMDEGSGSYVYNQDNGCTNCYPRMQFYGDADWTTDGHTNSGVELDGSSDALYTNDCCYHYAYDDRTMEISIKTETDDGGVILKSGYNSGCCSYNTGSDITIWMNTDGTIGAGFYGYEDNDCCEWVSIESSGSYNDGEWHHIVLTFDQQSSSGDFLLYVDGDLVASKYDNWMRTDYSGYNTYLMVGYGYHTDMDYNSNYWWEGTVDNLRFSRYDIREPDEFLIKDGMLQYMGGPGERSTAADVFTGVQNDALIDFDWGLDGAFPNQNINGFAASWTGVIEAPVAGTYKFRTMVNDGVRFYIDGSMKIDKWTCGSGIPTNSPVNHTVNVSLSKGLHFIKMDVGDCDGMAEAHLYWTIPVLCTDCEGYEVLVPPARHNTSLTWGITNPTDDMTDIWYPMDEGSGSYVYNQDNGCTNCYPRMQFYGDADWTTDGHTNSGVEFDGSSDALYTSDGSVINNGDDFTVELSFKTDTTNGGVIASSNYNSGCCSTNYQRDFMIWMESDGSLGAGYYGYWDNSCCGWRSVEDSGQWNDDEWHHIVVTWDQQSWSGDLIIYVDGEVVAAEYDNYMYPQYTGYNSYWRLGHGYHHSHMSASDAWWEGTVDNFRFSRYDIREPDEFLIQNVPIEIPMDTALGVTLGPIWSSNGASQNSLKFDGLRSYVEVPCLANSTCSGRYDYFTAEAFVKLPVDFAEGGVVIGGGYQGEYKLGVNKDRYPFFNIRMTNGNWYSLTGTTAIPLEEWRDIAGTYNVTSNSIKLYLDGVLQANGTIPSEYVIQAYVSPTRVGMHSTGLEPFYGHIDAVRITGTDLSPAGMFTRILSASASFSNSNFPLGNHTIYFRVKDNDGAWSERASTQLTVINNIPEAILTSHQYNYAEGDRVIIQGNGTDIDGTIEKYRWVSSIDGLVGKNAELNTTKLSAGNHTISFTVRDDSGSWSSANTTWVYVNDYPVVTYTPNVPAVEYGESITFYGNATDGIGHITQYLWTSDVDGNLANTLNLTISNLTFTSHNITFKAWDNDTLYKSYTLLINVTYKPAATVNSISPTSGHQDTSFAFNGSGSDTSGYIVEYQWKSNSDGVIGTSAVFNTTSLSCCKDHNISFRVKDNSSMWSDWKYYSLNITVYNAKPIANITYYSSNVSQQGSNFTFNGTGSDLDGTISNFKWYSSPEEMLFNGTDSNVTHQFNDTGTYIIYFMVQDNDGLWSDSVNITIRVTGPPTVTISNLTPTRVIVGTAINFTASMNDDGTITNMQWFNSTYPGDDYYLVGCNETRCEWTIDTNLTNPENTRTDTWYPMDAGSGSYIYNQDNCNDCSPYMYRYGDTDWVTGWNGSGYAIELDGSSDGYYEQSSNHNNMDDMTIEISIKTETDDGGMILSDTRYNSMTDYDQNRDGLSIWMNTDGTIGAGYYGYRANGECCYWVAIESSDSFNDGVWHHIVVTWDTQSNSGDMLLYVDEELVAAKYDSWMRNNYGGYNGYWRTGYGYHEGMTYNSDYWWEGTVDNMRYSRYDILTPKQFLVQNTGNNTVYYNHNLLGTTNPLNVTLDYGYSYVTFRAKDNDGYWSTNATHTVFVYTDNYLNITKSVLNRTESTLLKLNYDDPQIDESKLTVEIQYQAERRGRTPLWSYDMGSSNSYVESSSDGEYLAGYNYRTVAMFDSLTGEQLWSHTFSYNIRDIALSGDGQYVLVAAEDNRVHLFNRTGTYKWNYHIGSTIMDLDISSDGHYMVAGSNNDRVYLFKYDDSTPSWSYQTGGDVTTVSISADGRYIFVGSDDNYVYLFDKDSSQYRWRYQTSYDIKDVDASDDGEYLVAGTRQYMYVWDKDSSNYISRYSTSDLDDSYEYWWNDVGISGDGETVYGAYYRYSNNEYDDGRVDKIYIWNREDSWSNYKTKYDLYNMNPRTYAWSTSISKDGTSLSVAQNDGVLALIDKGSNTPRLTYAADGSVRSVSQAADGSVTFLGTNTGLVHLLQRDVILPEGTTSTNGIPNDIDVSDDGNWVGLGTSSYRVYILSADGSVTRYYDTQGSVTTVDFTPGGEFLTVGSDDDRVYLFKNSSSAPLWSYSTGGNVKDVRISDDLSYIVAGSIDDKLYLISRTSGSKVWSTDLGADVSIVAISSDSSRLAAVAGDTLYFFNSSSSTSLWSKDYGHTITSMSMSSDASRIVVGLSNGTLQLVSTSGNSSVIWTYSSGSSINFADMSYDGERIIMSNSANKIFSFTNATSIAQWEYTSTTSIVGLKLGGNGSNAIVSFNDQSFALFNSDSSVPLWHYTAWNDIESSGISKGGEVIYTGTDNNKILKFLKNPWGSGFVGNLEYNQDHWEATFNATKHAGSGNYTLRVRFTPEDGSPTKWYTYNNSITLSNLNPSVEITSSPDSIVVSDESLYFAGKGTDSDGLIISYLWTSSLDNLISTSSSFSTSSLSAGNHTVYLRVQDNDGYWSSPVNVSFRVVNRPVGTINSISPTSAHQSQYVTFNGSATGDFDITEYQWFSDRDGYISNQSIFSTDELSCCYTHTISFRAKDSIGTWSTNVTSTVAIYNAQPEAHYNIDPSDKEEGDTLRFNATGTDADGTISQYHWYICRNSSCSDYYTQQVNLTALVGDSQYAKLRVKDNDGSWSSWNTTYYSVSNIKPTASISSISPSDPDEEETITFSGSGSDTLGSISVYKWWSSPSSLDCEGSGCSNTTHDFDGYGDYIIYFKVKDDEGDWSDTVSETIHVNRLPIATIDSISPSPAQKDATVSFYGSGSDPDNSIIAYQWVSSIDGQLSTEENFTYSSLSYGNHTISFRIKSNDTIWSSYDTEILTIYDPPVAYAGQDMTIKTEEAVQFNGQGTDADGGTITMFEWDFDGNGIYDWSSKTNGLYMFTYNKPGTYEAKLRVTDNLGYTGTNVVNITVVSSGFAAPSIKVTWPNGGENIMHGENYTITWDALGDLNGSTPISIYYSLDGGVNWTTITSSTSNDGYHVWSVPSNQNIERALIRITVSGLDGNTYEDTSDGTFSIDPPEFWQTDETEIVDENPPTIVFNGFEGATSGIPYSVRAIVEDDNLVTQVFLSYSLNEGDYVSVAMSPIGDNLWEVVIIPLTGNMTMKISATDGQNIVESDEQYLEVESQSSSSENDNSAIYKGLLGAGAIVTLGLLGIVYYATRFEIG